MEIILFLIIYVNYIFFELAAEFNNSKEKRKLKEKHCNEK